MSGLFPTLLKRACRWAGPLCLVLLLAACSSTPMTTSLLQSKSPFPSQAEIEKTPFFPQEQYQCGPAALATVLHFQDQQTQPDELIEKVYIPQKQGSVPLEITATARGYHFIPYPLDSSLEKLVQEIAAGHPVIVMQNLGFSWKPQWHYAVVIGYDLNKQVFVLRSGTVKRHITPFKTFERTWRRADYWALVILPPDRVPATATAPKYLRIAHDLENTGQRLNALTAYRTASRQWPDNPLPWLALGNAYYAGKNLPAAEQALREGLTMNRNSAQLWNNLGYVLQAQGCSKQAYEAISCAIQKQPGNPDFQQSLAEITTQAEKSNSCAAVLCLD